MRLLAVLSVLSAVALAAPYDISSEEAGLTLQYASTGYTPDESLIINEFVSQLNSITNYNGTNSTDCERCIKRLQLGKSLAFTRSDLIYPVFTKWCIDNDIDDETTCELTYGRTTVNQDGSGSNFANLLYLMDPNSYDGQLYCFYHDSASCDLPETPEIDLSDKWPAKQDKHKIAPTPGNETYNVLHLSDFHIQTEYKIGSEANCSQYMCCTEHNYNSKTVNSTSYNFTESYGFTAEQISNLSYSEAWYDDDFNFVKGDTIDALANSSIWTPAFTFGSYKCDSPEVLINNSLLSIAKYQEELNLDFNFTIYTGDLVDHDEEAYIDLEKVIKSEESIFRDVKAILKDIPMYPVLGNHDTFPYAQMAQKKSGFDNLFDWNAKLMSDLWEDYGWLDSEQARYSREHYTGFSVTTKGNLKVIALNSNTYYQSNLYAFWNATDVDSFGQFQFLIDELVESEENDQRVWIIAHIPFIEEALPVPAEAMRQIIDRFSPYTIAGVFFGHTHADQFNVLYDGEGKNESNVVNNVWISQAITPLIENNPSWRYYEVDKKTHSIMQSYNYYLALDETFTNDTEEPQWQFEYSARDSYNVSWPQDAPLNGTFWHRVANQVRDDQDVEQTYINFMKRFSPYVANCKTTDSFCSNTYCYVSSFTLAEFLDCMGVDAATFWTSG